jgi:hypothetical protein
MNIRSGRNISILKVAVARQSAEALGKALRVGASGTSKATKFTHQQLQDAGEAFAKGLGKDPKKGKAVGAAILPTAGTVGVAQSDPIQELRARKGILVPSRYGGYMPF